MSLETIAAALAVADTSFTLLALIVLICIGISLRRIAKQARALVDFHTTGWDEDITEESAATAAKTLTQEEINNAAYHHMKLPVADAKRETEVTADVERFSK